MENKLVLPAKFLKVNRRKSDRIVVLTFESGKEITSAELGVMDAFCLDNEEGWLAFSPNKVQIEEVPKMDSEIETKSPSKRFRDVLYVLWDQQGKHGEFETFYRSEMDKIINHYKAKLLP